MDDAQLKRNCSIQRTSRAHKTCRILCRFDSSKGVPTQGNRRVRPCTEMSGVRRRQRKCMAGACKRCWWQTDWGGGHKPCSPKAMIGHSMAQLMPIMHSVPSRTDSSSRPGVVESLQLLGFEMMNRMAIMMNHITCDASPAIASTGKKSELICHLHRQPRYQPMGASCGHDWTLGCGAASGLACATSCRAIGALASMPFAPSPTVLFRSRVAAVMG